jgi:hypothetical protein
VVGPDDDGAFGDEPTGTGIADARRCARDEGDLSFETSCVHVVSLL